MASFMPCQVALRARLKQRRRVISDTQRDILSLGIMKKGSSARSPGMRSVVWL